MTKQTIRLVDVFCVAANWQSSIDTNLHTLAHYKCESGPFFDEITAEIKDWSARRDKALAKLRVINDGLTDHEKQWVLNKCWGVRLADDFRKLGIEPSWM